MIKLSSVLIRETLVAQQVSPGSFMKLNTKTIRLFCIATMVFVNAHLVGMMLGQTDPSTSKNFVYQSGWSFQQNLNSYSLSLRPSGNSARPSGDIHENQIANENWSAKNRSIRVAQLPPTQGAVENGLSLKSFPVQETGIPKARSKFPPIDEAFFPGGQDQDPSPILQEPQQNNSGVVKEEQAREQDGSPELAPGQPGIPQKEETPPTQSVLENDSSSEGGLGTTDLPPFEIQPPVQSQTLQPEDPQFDSQQLNSEHFTNPGLGPPTNGLPNQGLLNQGALSRGAPNYGVPNYDPHAFGGQGNVFQNAYSPQNNLSTLAPRRDVYANSQSMPGPYVNNPYINGGGMMGYDRNFIPSPQVRNAPPIRPGSNGIIYKSKFEAERSPESQQFWDQFLTVPPEGGQYGRTEDYSSFGSILANGYFYGRAEFALMEPHFQNNGGLTTNNGRQRFVEPLDFDFEFTPRYVFGFETNAGPGFEVVYWQFNEFSDGLNFTSNGVNSGSVSVNGGAINNTISISAAAAGETIQSRHHMTVNSTKVNFFKAFQAPVARFRGSLGVRYAQLDHELLANVNNGNSLFSNSNFRGAGPNIEIDYMRPIGHTPLKLVGGFGLSAMFGHRDQTIFENSQLIYRETGADSLAAVLEMHMGVEFRQKISRCNSVLVRTTFESQHWFNGGTAVDPTDDFGLYGFVISAGFTR